MRGGSRRAADAISISPRQFDWDRGALATLRHSTLPWEGAPADLTLRAAPLATAGQLGRRDRLSLLAQFAAHQGLLRFAGIGDGELDPAEWAIVQKRGADCRLIRVGARGVQDDAPPALSVAQQFADFVDAPPLETMRQSWARSESIYIESFRRLREDAAADLTWARRAAAGYVLAPGRDALRDITCRRELRWTYDDPLTVEALEACAVLDPSLRVVILRGRAIVRYGALAALRSLGITDLERLSEAAIVESVAAILPSAPVVFVVADPQSFDAGSSRVVQMLGSVGSAVWVTPGERPNLPRTRWYVVAPQIAAAREFEQQIDRAEERRALVDEFVGGAPLEELLDRGTVSVGTSQVRSVEEPRRSFLSALALLGPAIPLVRARRLLAEFMFEQSLDELVVPGLTSVSSDEFTFASELVRRGFSRLIPESSRSAICRVAAAIARESGDVARAGSLLIEAGDTSQAVEALASVSWPDEAAMVASLDGIPRTALGASRPLAAAYGRALVRAARYADARELAGAMTADDGELVLAAVERRTGDYASALARLERLPRSCTADLLRAEILGVLRRDEEAAALLQTTPAANDEERVAVGYARSLLRRQEDESWTKLPTPLASFWRMRLQTYRALDDGDVETALCSIAEALAAADCVVDRVDILMDRVFTLFSAGRWPEARGAALEGLTVVEETQGDRGAGGLLFLLAYLAADDGQWAHAAQRIGRLRHFYGSTRDERHLAEIDLLNAHLEFSRGRFAEARRLAEPLIAPRHDQPIRVAAALIVDEADWVEGRPARAPIETGSPHNAEFSDRMALLALRRGRTAGAFNDAFNEALARWERSGGAIPNAQSGSERLKLFRSLLSLGRKRSDTALLAAAQQIAQAMNIEVDEATATDGEPSIRILRSVVVRDFPFGPSDLGCAWRYAVRNRLEQWSEIGSLPPLSSRELGEIALAPPAGWMACSERELLFIEGSAAWTREARDAVAMAFRTRAELHRLRRIVEQEEAAPTQRPALSGIIGESPAIRDVIERAALVARRDVSVCILGESGTGKELVARAIHGGSPRRHKPFTAVNCGALPENLVESELFGHVRGAFTGADRDRAGLIEVTDGGTLFLDEIGEMPLVAQAKLLRFLQEGEFRRVGDTANRSADVRIVTATNRKLDEAVESGRFREDLYYRVAGIEILLPPLRERGADILALASHFLALERDRHRSGPSRFSQEVEAVLASYSWPGNVRELQNTIRGAHAVGGEAKEIALEHLPDRLRSVIVPRTQPGSYQDAVARFRRDLIERALGESDGNQNRAAAMLKISRQALGYQIRELGIMVGKAPRPRSAAS